MKMHLTNLSVRELYGRTYDLNLHDLSPTLTAIYGKNASGKSVLAEAASRIFSSTHRRTLDRTDRILARLAINGTTHDVNLRGPDDAVAWPQSARVGLYRLSVADLVTGPANEDQQRITEALAGGMDLKAIQATKAGKPPRAVLQNAWDTLQERQRESTTLRTQENSLDEKRRALKTARQAHEDDQHLQAWLNAAEHEREAKAFDATIKEIEAEHPGIDKQFENAPGLVRDSYEAFTQSCDVLRGALQSLRNFGSRRSRQALQRLDAEALNNLQHHQSQLTGELAQAKMNVAAAELKAQNTQSELRQSADHSAPAPLSAEDRQRLADSVRKIAETREALQASDVEGRSANQALVAAQTSFINAGGNPDDHPDQAPPIDTIQEAVQCDQDIATAAAELERAKQQRTHVQIVCDRARADIPGIKIPPRDVLNQLLQDPKIAILQDNLREVREQRNALQAIADQCEQESKPGRENAAQDQQAIEALRDWLRAIPEPAAGASTWPVVAIACALALVAAVAGLIISWVVGTAVGIASLVIVALLVKIHSRVKTPFQDRRNEVAERIPQQWRPGTWSADAVADKLAAALRQAQESQARETIARDARTRASAFNDRGLPAQLQQRRDLFTAATGVTLDDDYKLANVVHQLQRLMEADENLASAKHHEIAATAIHTELVNKRETLLVTIASPAKTGQAAKAWRDALGSLFEAEAAAREAADRRQFDHTQTQAAQQQLRELLQKFEWSVQGDLETAKTGLELWFTRTEAALAAEQDLKNAQKKLEALNNDFDANRDALRHLFKKYGFPCPQEPAEAIAPFRDWFEESRRLTDARASRKTAKGSLSRLLRDNGVPQRLPGAAQCASLEQRQMIPEKRNTTAAALRKCHQDKRSRLDQAQALRGQRKWPELFVRLQVAPQPTEEAVRERQTIFAAHAAGADRLNKEIIESETQIRSAEQANDLAGFEISMAKAVTQMENWLDSRLDEIASQAVTNRIADSVRKEATPLIIEQANKHLKDLTGGRYCDIQITDKDLTVADEAEEGRRKAVGELSTGSRVHLALAARLAVIENSENGTCRFPLLLDEVMATSDPDASAAIAASVKKISQDRQVLAFTNQPDDLNILRQFVDPDLQVRILGQTLLPHMEQPAVAPHSPIPAQPQGLPLTSALNQWPPALLRSLIPELDPSASTVHEAITRLDPAAHDRITPILEAFETARQAIAPAYRRVNGADLATVPWITSAYRPTVQKELEVSGGDPRQFLERFRKLPRMREENKQACEDWLHEQGYLAEPPTSHEVTELAREKFPPSSPNRLATAEAIARFFAPFCSI